MKWIFERFSLFIHDIEPIILNSMYRYTPDNYGGNEIVSNYAFKKSCGKELVISKSVRGVNGTYVSSKLPAQNTL